MCIRDRGSGRNDRTAEEVISDRGGRSPVELVRVGGVVDVAQAPERIASDQVVRGAPKIRVAPGGDVHAVDLVPALVQELEADEDDVSQGSRTVVGEGALLDLDPEGIRGSGVVR